MKPSRYVKEKISLDQAKTYLELLIGQEVHLTCGYGGVMFLDFGNLKETNYPGRVPKLYYGDYHLFCDETWEFETKSGKRFDRWHDPLSSFNRDRYFGRLGVRSVEKVEAIGAFDRVKFHLSGGYIFTIVKVDELSTFTLTMFPEQQRMRVLGDGSVELSSGIDEQHSWSKPGKIHKRPSKNVSISREFFRTHCPEYQPISFDKAREFTSLVVGQPVQNVEITSGTKFTINFGLDNHSDSNSLSRLYLSIGELWTLKADKKEVLDVSQHRWNFGEKLQNVLTGKKLTGLNYSAEGKDLLLEFEGGYSITLQDSGRYSRWDFTDRFTGICIDSIREDGLRYLLSTPRHSSKAFTKQDIHLDGILSQLAFYHQKLWFSL